MSASKPTSYGQPQLQLWGVQLGAGRSRGSPPEVAPRTSTLASRLPQPVQMVPLSLAAAGRLRACLFSCSLTRPGMRAPSKALGVNSQLQQADSRLPIQGWGPRQECCGQSQCPEARAGMRPGGVGGGRLQGKSMCKGSAARGSRTSGSE